MDLTSLGSDLRQALRSLRRNPGLTLVVLAVVALGIGANTATLSIVHTVLARPLSYEKPERLVVVWEKRQAPGAEQRRDHVMRGHGNDGVARREQQTGVLLADCCR